MTTFKGKACYEPGLTLKDLEYTPQPLGEEDVEIEIKFSGICHSDLHFMKGEWGPQPLPMIPGHEIAGVITKVGARAKGWSVGDHAGVGPLAFSCDKCSLCADKLHQYCATKLFLYSSIYPSGVKVHGGYANFIRVQGNAAVHLDTRLPLERAAPLLCAGATVFKPLRDYNVGPGKTVGVIGIGGLGHLAVQFAAKMGARVVAISHSYAKKELAIKLGASEFMSLGEKADVAKFKQSMHVVLMTASAKLNWTDALGLVRPQGTFVFLGAPGGNTVDLNVMANLIFPGVAVAGSLIGSKTETQEMADFAAKHNVLPMTETRPLSDINNIMQDMDAGKALFRYVLDISK